MTKISRVKCLWCRQRFKPNARGRPQLFCGRGCRQRAYEKRKWSEYAGTDALALDLLPLAAHRRLAAEVRHAHMVELIKRGVVRLDDPTQIDGVLDPRKQQDRLPLLNQIESACRERGDEEALAIIARWRLARQAERGASRPPPKPA